MQACKHACIIIFKTHIPHVSYARTQSTKMNTQSDVKFPFEADPASPNFAQLSYEGKGEGQKNREIELFLRNLEKSSKRWMSSSFGKNADSVEISPVLLKQKIISIIITLWEGRIYCIRTIDAKKCLEFIARLFKQWLIRRLSESYHIQRLLISRRFCEQCFDALIGQNSTKLIICSGIIFRFLGNLL